MYYNKWLFAIIALLVISDNVYGKKVKKNKRPKEPEDPTTLQPNVVAYSTFGFNDVGSYDGFVPTSPEYSSFLSGGNQESSTRLYAPAFPSAADSTGFSGNYGSPSFEGPFGMSEDAAGQPGMSHYTSNSMNYMNNPNFATTGEQNKNNDAENVNNQNADDSDAPIYGTKIGAKTKNRPAYPNNNADFNGPNNGFSNPSDDKFFNYNHEIEPVQEKPAFNELNSSYQNTNNYAPSFGPHENEDFAKPESFNSNAQNVLNFPRVVDFTKLTNKYYPTELDTSKLTSESIKHSNQQMSMANAQIDNSFANYFNNNKFMDNSPTSFGEPYNSKNNEEFNDKNIFKSNTFFDPDYTNKHVASHYKHIETTTKKPEQKKKIKQKPWNSGNYSNAFKDWKDASATSSSSLKGYGYSTNYSNMNFKYDVSEPKKPFKHEEIVPASSNIVDLTSYQYPEKDYSNFKKMPEYNNDDEYLGGPSYKEKFKSSDYLNQFKNSFTTVPTTTSSYWGSFKSTDYSSFSEHPKKHHQYSVTENNYDDVVNIPKRPHRYNFNKGSQNKQIDWPPTHYRPQKLNRPSHDWTKDFLDTRYKSEEDLLGLRTHDTSHPSYLPTYKPSNNVLDNDNEFKQLVERWKQSYIKTKYKDVPVRDYEGYGSEVKQYHVPIPKPYPIEVPHPVIVPVPRPFPVRVPISRPVAVPVLRELTVPIVKPVPYPVYKNVPYPVEKPVPVPVEKEVAVPVEKPYPVHIPYVRPVFHHTKPVHEEMDEEEYPRRPEYKKPSQYKKRPAYGTRNRRQRPSRTSYQDRNRRRWPERRPAGYNSEYRPSSRPNGFQHSSPYRHRDYERDTEEDEHSDYATYCRKTGNC